MIIGRPGSGKSTFSVMLQKSLNISLFHLDKYFFIADWVPRECENFLSLQKELVAKLSLAGLLMVIPVNHSRYVIAKPTCACTLIYPSGYVIGGYLSAYFIRLQKLMIEPLVAMKRYDGRY